MRPRASAYCIPISRVPTKNLVLSQYQRQSFPSKAKAGSAKHFGGQGRAAKHSKPLVRHLCTCSWCMTCHITMTSSVPPPSPAHFSHPTTLSLPGSHMLTEAQHHRTPPRQVAPRFPPKPHKPQSHAAANHSPNREERLPGHFLVPDR